MANPQVNAVLTRHDNWLNETLANFQRELNGIVHSAQMRTQARLRDELEIKDDKIILSVQNSRKLRRLDAIFLEEMDRSGYRHLINELVSQFPGQLPVFNEILEAIGAQPVKFSPKDLRLFQDQAISAGDALEATVEMAANAAKNRIMFSFNGLSLPKLVDTLIESTGKTVAAAVRTAETATSVYFRVVSDRGFQSIEATRPESAGPLRYRYAGPFDKLTRPFCSHLLMVAKAYTRDEIDRMDNGQLPNVFVTCGGYLCRHQWIVDL